MSDFIYKGLNSSAKGIKLSRPISISPLIPNVIERTIPARNGILHFWDGSYANRSIVVDCFTFGDDVHANINAINDWLIGDFGYYEFSDASDTEHFMLARAIRGVDEQIKANTLNPFVLEFDARPERFLTSGKLESILTSGTLTNPTKFASRPILRFGGGSSSAVTINGHTIRISGISGEITYDAESEVAYSESGTPVNALVTTDGVIEIAGGENTVTVTGGATVTIVPRWWEA